MWSLKETVPPFGWIPLPKPLLQTHCAGGRVAGRIPVPVGVLPGFRGGPALSSVPYRGAFEQIGWHINPLSLRTSSIMTWIGLPCASGPSHVWACVSRCFSLDFLCYFATTFLSAAARDTPSMTLFFLAFVICLLGFFASLLLRCGEMVVRRSPSSPSEVFIRLRSMKPLDLSVLIATPYPH